jgi:hypothetical protein
VKFSLILKLREPGAGSSAKKYFELPVDIGAEASYLDGINKQEKQMTKEEALDALNESGVDYEVVAEHDYGYHIIVKFEKEEE